LGGLLALKRRSRYAARTVALTRFSFHLIIEFRRLNILLPTL
jgi:hypothetical protein